MDARAPSFTLTDQYGSPFSLTGQLGYEVVLFFGYTHCPDVCPETLARIAQAVKKLPSSDAKRVHVAFVTVDPARDNAATLGRYVRLFDPAFYGLTGTESQLDPVYRSYNVVHEKLPGSAATGYLMMHSSTIYFIDPRGRLRVLHDWNDGTQPILHDMKELLS